MFEVAGRASGSSPDSSGSYVNYAAPPDAVEAGSDAIGQGVADAVAYDRKFAGGYPVAAAQLAKREQIALATGVSPRDQLRPPTDDALRAKLLTILVEFDPHADDDFSGVRVPESVYGSRTCVELPEGTLRSGPLHNRIQNPAEYDHLDNQTFWIPDFDRNHYNDMLYSKEGITERVRMDLTGPDGEPGVDISGFSLRKMYKHMSEDSYVITGEATAWVEVAHSEAWYGATVCYQDADGNWVAPARQSNDGHPDNPLDTDQLAIDAVTALAAVQPDFPFADYDQEDVADLDGDNDFHEPDGTIDHVALIHAGMDKSAFGSAQGSDGIWSNSNAILGGYEIPGTGVRIDNYVNLPENGGVGIVAHEYGHDLGLPDLYDVSGAGGADTEFWDLMAVGSHTGPVYQSMPTYMGLWDRWVLGWAEPVAFEPGAAGGVVDIGESPYRPEGSQDGIIVNLPPKAVTLAEPHSGEEMWYGQDDQAWANNSITRGIEVPAGADVRFWSWDNYIIEQDWDFGFIEVSTDGGVTFSQAKVHAEDGTEVSTPDDYADPHGILATFDKAHGLTGSSDGWRHDYIDLTPYAGESVQVRLTYATDSGFQERGWFADDFAVTADGVQTWADDVESGSNGWVTTIDSWQPDEPLGAGWVIDTGTSINEQFYLAEWRTFHGFDQGLRYAYDTTYSAQGSWKVDRTKYNSRGMLVWHRDATYGEVNSVTATTQDLPSVGSKGGLLLVDSHYDPLRRRGVAAAKDTSTLNNLASRPQASNVAFGLHPTFRFTECLADVVGEDPYAEFCTDIGRSDGVSAFHDDVTWYPGIEVRNLKQDEQTFYFRDIDASTVIPNGNNDSYSTRVVDRHGEAIPQWYGETQLGALLGTGEPTLPYGVELELESVGDHNRFATVRVTPSSPVLR